MAWNNDEPLLESNRTQLRWDEATGSNGIWVDKPDVFLAEDASDEDYEAIRDSVYGSGSDLGEADGAC